MVSGQYMPTNKAKMSLAGSWGMHLLHASLWARVPRSDLNRREIDTKSIEETIQTAIQIAAAPYWCRARALGRFFIVTI